MDKQNNVQDFVSNTSNLANNKDQVIDYNVKEDSNIHKALMTVIDDLSKEVKNLQENVVGQLQFDNFSTNVASTNLTSLKDVDSSSQISDSSGLRDGPHKESVQDSNVNTGNGLSITPDDELLVNVSAAVKELEKENKSLKEKLEKESHDKTQIVSEMNNLNHTLSCVMTQLQTTNKIFDTKTCHIDEVNAELSLDDDLMRELNLCVQRLYKTMNDLCILQDLREIQESSLKTIRDEVERLKTENNQLLMSRDLFHAEANVECNKLKEQLLSLQQQHSSLVLEKESMILEISNLKSKNEEVENQIKNNLNSLSILEQKCNTKQIAIENSELNFANEKKVLQDNISKLEMEVKEAQENLLSSLEEKEKCEADTLLLKNENNNIVNENNILLIKLDEIQNKLEKSKHDCKEIEDKLSHGLLLKEQDDSCKASEKEELNTKICMLEENLKKNNQDLTSTKQAKDVLSKELALLKREYDSCNNEKIQIQNKILNLEHDLETCKCNLLTTAETEKKLLEEILNLKNCKHECESQNKELQNKVLALTMEYENHKTLSVSDRQSMIQELESIKQDNENLKVENNSLLKKVGNLEDEIVSSKANLASTIEIENKLAEELTDLKNELIIKTENSNELQEKYDNLLSKCSKCTEDYKHLLEIKNKLSDDLVSMTNLKDNLDLEKNNLQEKVDILTSNSQNLEDKVENVAKAKQKLLEEIAALKNLEDTVDAEKCHMKTRIEELETEVNSCKNYMLLTLEEKNKVVEEVAFLKTEIDDYTKENKELKEKLNNILKKLEKNKIDFSKVKQEKDKFVEELSILRKERDESFCTLRKTEEQLEHQQQLCESMEKHSNELAHQLSLLELKCTNMEKECEENVLLKTDLESLHNKISEAESLTDKISLEKQHVVNSILKKLTDVRNIKNLQESLLECVLKFRTEVLNELNHLKTKVVVDLVDEVNRTVQENRRNNELQFKRKDEIDTYNSQIKNFEEELQKSNKDSETSLYSQTNKDNAIGKQQYQKTNNVDPQGEKPASNTSGCLEDISKLNEKALYYQKKCCDIEISLKQAYTILKCLSNSLLMHDLEKSVSLKSDGFLPKTDDGANVNCGEQNSVQKHLAALKLFLQDYEAKQIIDGLDLSIIDPNSVPAFLDNNNDSIVLKSEVRENLSVRNVTSCMSSETSDSLKINQLLQELHLKDDIIKELQCLVEEYEKHSPRNSPSCQTELSLNDSGIDDCNKCSVEKHANYTHLEEENKVLLQKIQQLKKSHASTIENIKAEYEELLEERDEHHNTYEKEELGKFFIKN